MTRSKPITLLATVAIPLTALAVAGCGGGNETASQTPAKAASGQATTVNVARTGLGKVLVDSKGRTIYLFKKDSGTKSVCRGSAPTTGPRFVPTARRPSATVRTPRWWPPPNGPTEHHRSPTTATRSISTRATKSPATQTAKA